MRPCHSSSALILLAFILTGCGTNEPRYEGPCPTDPGTHARREQDALKRWENDFQVTATQDEKLPGGRVVALELSSRLTDKNLGENPPVFDDKLDLLVEFPHLRKLKLWCWITGAGLSHLAKNPELRELFINTSRLTDDGMKALPTLPNLEKIELGATEFTDIGLKELRRQPKLKDLELGIGNVTAEGLASLAEFPSLTRVSVYSHGDCDAQLKALAGISHLEHLSFHAETIYQPEKTKGSRVGLASLTARKDTLQSLRLGFSHLDADALLELRTLTKLTQFSLSGSGCVTDKAVAEISQWSNLKDLRLVLTRNLTNEGLRPLSKMTQLESLSLEFAFAVSDSGMEHIGKLTNLRELSLRGCSIEDAGIAHLSRLSRLQSLNLHLNHDSTITSAGLPHLAGMQDLEKLDMFSSKVTDDGIDFLMKFKKLKYIDLRDSKVTPAGAERLRKALPGAEVKL